MEVLFSGCHSEKKALSLESIFFLNCTHLGQKENNFTTLLYG